MYFWGWVSVWETETEAPGFWERLKVWQGATPATSE